MWNPITASILVLASQAAPPAPPEPQRGAVTIAGAPAAGVRVTLHTAYGGGTIMRLEGFSQRSAPNPGAIATTGSDGRFELRVPAKGSWYVRAESRGFAPAEIGPIDLEPAGPKAELKFQLDAGATIVGRVAPEREGGRIEGISVCASRGDSLPRSTLTDGKGEYRFELLTPGGWHVRAQPRIPGAQGGNFEMSKLGTELLPLPVDAKAGVDTRFDIDLAREPRFVGRLALGHKPLQGWRATLRGPGASPRIDDAVIDATGTFRLAGETPGTHSLRILGQLDGVNVRIERTFELPKGETSWDRDFETGGLTVTVSDRKIQNVRLALEEADGLAMTLSAVPDGQGTIRLKTLPVGMWHAVHAVLDSATELAQVPVKPGQESWLEVP